MGSQCKGPAGLTLMELLVVVALVAVLAALAVVNYNLAVNRALKSSDAANLHTIATALQAYSVDYGALPPADREAGPFTSQGPEATAVGNGPAAGGSWDGLPWLLYEWKYMEEWKSLFCPKYVRRYSGAGTIRGGFARYHNFRYAYNSSASSSGGPLGGSGDINSGTVWMVRDLWLSAERGWWADQYPRYPADYTFPWGEGDSAGKLEHVLYADGAVKTVIGGE